MNLRKLLSKDNIFLDLKSNTKEEIIEEIIDRLVASGKIKDRNAALKAILERERKMSTGMENGIALPHGKNNSVDKLITAIAVKKEGVDFDSIDKKPAKIFVLTLSPLNRTGPHIQFLAETSKLLRDSETREKVLSAKTPKEIIRLFNE
ncbi:MAG: PTS sugar transporter subunit IIA [Candidatus Aminicenantes bacterium]|nr:PTS sugar transporter subunit IIA [Candidatus Aminicenantes bacterium]